MRVLAPFAALALVVAAPARADELVSAEVAAKTLLRALAYDRSLAPKDGAVVLAVVTKPGADGGDGAALETAIKGLGDVTIQGASVKVVHVDAASAADVEARLGELKPQVAYLAHGLEADAAKVQAAAQKLSVLTLYRAPGYQDALALGVVPREGKSRIVVRLAAAKASGAVLDPQLLRLAQVIE